MDTFVNKINKRPEKTDSKIPRGAICGNGDLAVVLDDENDDLIIHIGKSDFWKFTPGAREDGGIKAVGQVRISNCGLDTYNVTQYFKKGLVSCRFGNADIEIFTAVDNLIYITLSAPDNGKYPSFDVEIPTDCNSNNFEYSDKGMKWYLRKFDGSSVERESAVAVCCRRMTAEISDGIKKVVFCLGVAANFDTKDYISKSIQLSVDSDIERDRIATEKFWRNYFNASSVVLEDKEIEKYYNSSLYYLGCCMGNPHFPPGLFGNFITCDDMPWKSDYHLNYNYEAPFYCLFSSNHPEYTASYMQPLYDSLDKGKYFAGFENCKGVYFPVSLGPKGVDYYTQKDVKEHGILFLGQKSNAAYAAVIPVMHWYATYDNDFAIKNLYPYIKEVAAFWEDYLVKEKGRYIIKNDAVHEIPYYRGDKFRYITHKNQIEAKNNILSLGLVRMVFKCIIDMSKELGIDSDKLPVWQDILANISEFPTFIKRGKRCFRYSEKGISWRPENSVGLQHIYPASQVGLSSDKKLLKIARNTYFINDRRLDDNGSVSYLPCGARLGVDPQYLIEGIKLNIKEFGLPNLFFNRAGGCIEHFSTVPATVNEMLMQSHEGIIRIFPCWNGSMNAEFNNLRADGAFLVSSQLENGKVKSLSIKSLAGRVCRIQLPGNIPVTVKQTDGKKIKYKITDNYIEFKTQPDTTYVLI
ncbi:MAG: hypothetical protein IJZ35_07665 [Clostridia bacterium]|nr:hypothetical protein [Clostridia bacterium]